MPIYRRMCRFNIFVHFISLLAIHNYILITYSILMILQGSEYLAHIDCKLSHCRQKILLGKSTTANARFVSVIITCFLVTEFAFWQSLSYFVLEMCTRIQDIPQHYLRTASRVRHQICLQQFLVRSTLAITCRLSITMSKVFFRNSKFYMQS